MVNLPKYSCYSLCLLLMSDFHSLLDRCFYHHNHVRQTSFCTHQMIQTFPNCVKAIFMQPCDSNEAKVLAIPESLRCFSRYYRGNLIVESDSSNAVIWVSNRKAYSWKFQFFFNKIRVLSTTINVSFQHKSRSANMMADALAKQGVERVSPWEGFII